jgi:hypothetical protein
MNQAETNSREFHRRKRKWDRYYLSWGVLNGQVNANRQMEFGGRVTF